MSNRGAAKGAFHADVSAPLHERLLGEHPSIREINAFVREVARTDLTVFITGETGTGKDVVASMIHALSPRAKKPYIKVNFPGIPEGSLENELFGHERGAFTGAHSSRPGRFELARDGTVFMDEVCETSLQVQSKLTQVLDGEPFMRVGGTHLIQMRARVIAAANIGLEEAVAAGRLRRDIAFRLKEVVIQLPPLRRRREDIPLLAEHFNYHACKMMGKEYRELGPGIWEHLKAMEWRGNVRQLAAWVKEYVVTGTPDPAFLASPADTKGGRGGNGKTDSGEPKTSDFAPGKRRFISLTEAGRLAAENAERELIEDTLRYTLWNRRKAAKLLSTSYSSLLRRIDRYKIGKS